MTQTDLKESEIRNSYEFVTEELGRSARYETYSKRIQPTYKWLIEAAQAGETITYSELADYAETDNRHYMSILLDAIGYIEEKRNNPPTTVLVVHTNDNKPAGEFVDLLDSLGIRDRYSSTADDVLMNEIIAEVFERYQTVDTTSS